MATYFNIEDDKIRCTLCPHFCRLGNEQTGICHVRKNSGNSIDLLTYGVVSGYSLDPIEKKPLYHFYPGNNILSIGSFGCNMRCDFCQNWHISQSTTMELKRNVTTEEIIANALSELNNLGIAFTYNEPVIWFEFMRDIAASAKQADLLTAMVSNGYINTEPLSELLELIDAFNIDLKAFNNDFYRKFAGAELKPVKDALIQIAKSGKHLEITTLIIPGRNDSLKEMEKQVEWIAGELGENVPLHLSRYFPAFKRDDPVTSQERLTELYELASEKLDWVYIGNSSSEYGQNTICPSCESIVTSRSGYKTRLLNLDREGRCTCCGNKIYKHFASPTSSL